jgi:hypothetical protein
VLNEQEYAESTRIRAAFQRRAAEVSGNATMLPQDKAVKLSRLAKDMKAQLDGLSARSDERERAEGEKAWRTAFGLPPTADAATVMAARDAADRVREVSPAEAADLLAQALAMGDRTLAAAVGAKALAEAAANPLQSKHWGDVVDKYAATFPAKQAAIGLLAGQVADRNDRAAVLNDRVARQLPLPDEIRGRNIDALAALPLSTETGD